MAEGTACKTDQSHPSFSRFGFQFCGHPRWDVRGQCSHRQSIKGSRSFGNGCRDGRSSRQYRSVQGGGLLHFRNCRSSRSLFEIFRALRTEGGCLFAGKTFRNSGGTPYSSEQNSLFCGGLYLIASGFSDRSDAAKTLRLAGVCDGRCSSSTGAGKINSGINGSDSRGQKIRRLRGCSSGAGTSAIAFSKAGQTATHVGQAMQKAFQHHGMASHFRVLDLENKGVRIN